MNAKIKNTYKTKLFHLLSSNIVDKFLTIFNILILIDWLELEGYGIWTVLTSGCLIGDSLLSMGISTYSLEYIIQRGKKDNGNKLIEVSIIILIIKLIILSCIFYFFNSDYLTKIGGKIVILNLGCSLAFLEVGKVLQGLILALNKSQLILVCRTIQALTKTILLAFFFIFEFNKVTCSIAFLISSIVGTSILIKQYLKYYTIKENYNLIRLVKYAWKTETIEKYKKIIKKAIPFTLSSLAIFLYLKTDVLCLKYFSTQDDIIGSYGISASFVSLFYFLPINSNRSLLSDFNGKNENFLLNKYKVQMGICCVLIIIFQQIITYKIKYIDFIFTKTSLELISGYINILSIGLIGIYLNEYASLFFAIRKMNWLLNFKNYLTCILNIIFNIILIPIYGVIGACIGTAASLLCSGILMYLIKKNA